MPFRTTAGPRPGGGNHRPTFRPLEAVERTTVAPISDIPTTLRQASPRPDQPTATKKPHSTVRPSSVPAASASQRYEVLDVPPEFIDLLNELNEQIRDIGDFISNEVQTALRMLQDQIAHHHGISSSDIEVVQNSEGHFEFRRKLEARPSIKPKEIPVQRSVTGSDRTKAFISQNDESLSTGAIVGIVIGSVVLVIFCILAIRRIKRKQSLLA